MRTYRASLFQQARFWQMRARYWKETERQEKAKPQPNLHIVRVAKEGKLANLRFARNRIRLMLDI